MIDATPLLHGYARWRLGRLTAQDPVQEQERQLLRLVRRAAATRFGRDHGFKEIRSVSAFQNRVRLRHFEDMWEQNWQPAFPILTDCSWPGTIPYFALTSGTASSASKHIPVSREMNRANSWAAIEVLGASPREPAGEPCCRRQDADAGRQFGPDGIGAGHRQRRSQRHRGAASSVLGQAVQLPAAGDRADRRLGGEDRPHRARLPK